MGPWLEKDIWLTKNDYFSSAVAIMAMCQRESFELLHMHPPPPQMANKENHRPAAKAKVIYLLNKLRKTLHKLIYRTHINPTSLNNHLN